VAAAARPVIARIPPSAARRWSELDCDFFFDYAGPCRWPAPRASIRTREHSWPPLELGLLGRAPGGECSRRPSRVERCAKRVRPSRIPLCNGFAAVRAARPRSAGPLAWIVLDCAHNTAVGAGYDRHAGDHLARAPAHAARLSQPRPDNDVPACLRLLAPQFDEFFLTRFGRTPRRAPEQLAEWLGEYGGARRTFPPAAEAWQAGPSRAGRRSGGGQRLGVPAGELRPMMVGGIWSPSPGCGRG